MNEDYTIYETEKDWLSAKRGKLGASSASSVIGENQYKSNVELWREMTGRVEPEDISNKPQVRFGKEAEAPLRELFKLQFCNEYELIYKSPYQLFTSKKYDWMQCTPDGILIEKATGKIGNWECKTTDCSRNIHAWTAWKNQIPRGYYAQGLHQQYVLDVEFTIFTGYLYSDEYSSVRNYRIDRDEEIEAAISELVAREVEFMEYVKNNKRPPQIMWL